MDAVLDRIPFSYGHYIIMLALSALARLLPLARPRLAAPIATLKALADKKKKVYGSQLAEAAKTDAPLGTEERRARELQFEKALLEVSKELALAFGARTPPEKKRAEIAALVGRASLRVGKEQRALEARELLHFAEVVKGLCFSRLDQLELIEAVYEELGRFMGQPEHRRALEELGAGLWGEGVGLQVRVRAVSVVQFLGEEARRRYFAEVVPLVRFFKSSEMLVLLYEKWRYGYDYSYELVDQIHSNDYYLGIEEVGQAQFKMLFVETLKGQFGPNDDAIYGRVLNAVNDRPTVLAHSAFSALIRMLHSQHYFVQTEGARASLEFSLNNFINIAKSQNYERSALSLQQLVEIYLAFEESSATGEILLSEITYSARTQQLAITPGNFPLYQQLMASVLRNLEARLKYERRDFLNKEYTNDTLNFLREFLPKYLPLWPEVILELNDAARELFPAPDDPLLALLPPLFRRLADDPRRSLAHPAYCAKLLRFLATHHHSRLFALPPAAELALLAEIEAVPAEQLGSAQLEVLYLLLSLLGERTREGALRGAVGRLAEVLERRMQQEVGREKGGLINSEDEEVLWLALCGAQLRAQGFRMDESLLEIFVNEKVLYLVNSLRYLQVWEVMAFAASLSRIRAEVYERLLLNLSTFVIHVNEKLSRSATASPYYLNHKYLAYYPRIVRLVLDNPATFAAVANKNAFRMVQIMFHHGIAEHSNEDVLRLLFVLADQNVLIHSLAAHLEGLKFSAAQLEPYEHSLGLKHFEYYNRSLLRYFEGKYNESEIKKRLREDTLTRQEIAECFAKIEVYKTIIMDGQLSIRFDIPEPSTPLPDFKFMYACQRIFQKVRMFNDYDFRSDLRYAPQQQSTPVDLTAERRYIEREVLIPNTSFNEFRLEQRALPRYIKLEVWKNYLFVDSRCQVDRRDFELNQRRLIDEILHKVIKGAIYGSHEKIREVYREFNGNEELLAALREAGVPFEQQGAGIELKGEQEGEQLLLLSSNNTNYKILYICAHFIAAQGRRVLVLQEQQPAEPLLAFLAPHFAPRAPPSEEKLKEEENEENPE